MFKWQNFAAIPRRMVSVACKRWQTFFSFFCSCKIIYSAADAGTFVKCVLLCFVNLLKVLVTWLGKFYILILVHCLLNVILKMIFHFYYTVHDVPLFAMCNCKCKCKCSAAFIQISCKVFSHSLTKLMFL